MKTLILESYCKCGEEILEQLEWCNNDTELYLIRKCKRCSYRESWPLYY